MDKRKKRFCPKGHDTHIVGRTKERRCRTCNSEKSSAYNRSHPEAHSIASLKWIKANRDQDTNRRLQNKYGITLEDKKAMFHAQEGRCKICAFVFLSISSAHVDHCHRTKVVRGLLCSDCNHMIGKAKDDPDRLRLAADYLSRILLPA